MTQSLNIKILLLRKWTAFAMPQFPEYSRLQSNQHPERLIRKGNNSKNRTSFVFLFENSSNLLKIFETDFHNRRKLRFSF